MIVAILTGVYLHVAILSACETEKTGGYVLRRWITPVSIYIAPTGGEFSLASFSVSEISKINELLVKGEICEKPKAVQFAMQVSITGEFKYKEHAIKGIYFTTDQILFESVKKDGTFFTLSGSNTEVKILVHKANPAVVFTLSGPNAEENIFVHMTNPALEMLYSWSILDKAAC